MNTRRLAIILSAASVFMYGYTLPGIQLNVFAGVFVIAFAAIVISLGRNSIVLHRQVLLALILILLAGAIGVFLGRGPMSAYFTQALAIGLVTICATVVIAGSGSESAMIFPTYLELSFYFALIAIFELMLGQFGIYFELLTPRIEYALLNFHRISGFAAEPSHYCFVMTPSVVAILISSLLGRPCLSLLKSVIIVASYILTFSSVGLFMIAITLSVLMLRRSSVASFALKAVLAAGLVGAIITIPQINTRIVDTYEVFAISDSEDVNISSLTLYKNFLVTMESAFDQPFFGAGLGGHETNYYKYLPDSMLALGPNLNEKDANSMLLRLVSEFGIPFTIIFYLIVLRLWTGLPSPRDSIPVFWKKLTSSALLGLIIANSLRSGNYINHGFPFFLVLYFSVRNSLIFGDVRLSYPLPETRAARPA